MRLPQVALVITLAIAAVQIAYFYPQLPSVMAGHFGASGVPNAWQSKETFFSTIGLVYVLCAALYVIMPHLIMAMPPELINMPHKSYWLAPERREVTAHRVGDQLTWFGVAQIGFMIFVCQLAINANLPGSSGQLSPAIWWFVGGFLVCVLGWMIRFIRMFRVSRDSG